MLSFISVAFLWSACSTIDERDECCEEVVLIYRYVPTTRDEYTDNIHEITHYLFDAKGLFIRELQQTSPHSQRVVMRMLPVGNYTVLSIANRSNRFSQFSKPVEGETTLTQFTLEALYPTYNKDLDGDPLFWNIREIESRKEERHTYYCDISNIHCHLTVRVVWKGIFPPAPDGYRMELDHLPTIYQLYRPVYNGLYTLNESSNSNVNQGSTFGRAWHEFPQNRGANGRISASVPLFNNELQFTIRSLRYTDKQIPTLRIYQGGKLYRKELDLTRFFRDQGLRPDNDAVQNYKIVVEISDKDIKIYLWTGGRVVDWQDGGSIEATL